MRGRRSAILAVFGLAAQTASYAGPDGIATRATTGGLTIPSARVLDLGDIAFSAGNYEEPQLGLMPTRRNLSFGIGLFPNFELFGRHVQYENPPLPDSILLNGHRDISANVKYGLPKFWRGQPDVAVGGIDIFGGAVLFRSAYVVASDEIGPVGWTLGYARKGSGPAGMDGVFGGVDVKLGATGLSALAEYDGRQRNAGIRYQSPPLQSFGLSRVIATVQRSLGATDNSGRDVDKTSVGVSLVIPLEQIVERPKTFKPDRQLASLDRTETGMVASSEDRQQSLVRALAAAGLERVRVGTSGPDLVVEYENHLYAQNEADALGIVLGLASELAPKGARRIHVVTLKAGLPVYQTSVGVAEMRGYLRSGDAQFVNGNLAVDKGGHSFGESVRWIDPKPTRQRMLEVQVGPDLVNTLGTEIGSFDYSLAASVKGFAPLWRGAELYANYIQRLANSRNFEEGFFFGASRHRTGLKVAALQQSFWIDRRALVTVGVGRYNYDRAGAQIESTLFVPGRDDVVRVKAGVYQRQPGQTSSAATPLSGTYRWVMSQRTWVEAGLQQYSDGSRGPSVVLTRWFGNVGAHLFYRRGAHRQFAGLELTIPLTPDRGLQAGPVVFNGAPQYTKGVRTRLVGGSTRVNFVDPQAVLDFPLEYHAELRLLNGGRATEKYFISQLPRMRRAFYDYARDNLPD